MSSQVINASSSAKIKALKDKHSALESRIDEVMKSPSGTADFYLKQLKRQKLLLKDCIEDLSRRSANH